MNSKKIISAITAVVVLASSGLAFAQGKGNDRGRDRDDKGGRGEQMERRDDRNYNEGRRDERRDDRREERRDERGAGPNHNYYRGGRLPDDYRHRQYVVDDWRGHHLRAPPRGYHWVQSGGDYILIAIASGIIADILLSR